MICIWGIKTVKNTGGLRYYLERACERGFFNWMPDKPYLDLLYWARLGKGLNLKTPRTFNEKQQWLKLYNRKPEYTAMVDKYEAKLHIASIVGEEYVIPTLGVWDRFEDIDFDVLPNQFVLKCTHDSGCFILCRDKSKLDLAAAEKKIKKSLDVNYFFHGREWPYKNVKPRIIAEEYVEDTANDALTDYKFYCFHGTPKIMYISKDHGKEPFTDFFDMEFNHLPIIIQDPNAEVMPRRPEQFDRMKQFAEILSRNIPFLRVDFYEVSGKLYVGELTFFDGSGFELVEPKEWDEQMGAWIKLPL